jgi:hypothetical protein
VAEWEKTYLNGENVDTFLNRNTMTTPGDWRQPFYSEENWYLPILQPDYRTAEDNLIIMDTSSKMYFHQATDEFATFGCRYPRMITLSQEAFVDDLRDAAMFRFPISNLILLPGVEHGDEVLPVSEFQLPYCNHLVAMAMANAARQFF